MRLIGMAVALAASTTTAGAGEVTLFSCQMDRECIADESCNATEFSLTAEQSAESAHPFRFRSAAETIEGIDIRNDSETGATSLFARSGNAVYLLNVTAEGTAVWLVHLPEAEMAITYFGRCDAR